MSLAVLINSGESSVYRDRMYPSEELIERIPCVTRTFGAEREALNVPRGPVKENKGVLLASEPLRGLTARYNVVRSDLITE